MSKKQLGWAFARDKDAEDWHGIHPTRDTAIAAAWDYYGDVESIAVAPCHEPPPDAGEEEWDFAVSDRRETIQAPGWRPLPTAEGWWWRHVGGSPSTMSCVYISTTCLAHTSEQPRVRYYAACPPPTP